MELHNSDINLPRLTLTTREEIEVVSIIVNHEWARYPNVLHPFQRRLYRDLASRAFALAHSMEDVMPSFDLTVDETAIVAGGILHLSEELLRVSENQYYTTNTLARDAAALAIAEALAPVL